jgi:hypothetical protein
MHIVMVKATPPKQMNKHALAKALALGTSNK